MTNVNKINVAVAIALCICSQIVLSPTAKADDSRDLCVLAGVGYGIQDDEDAGSFGTAFALKGSYRLFDWIHLGVEGTFHIGSKFGDEQNRVHYYGVDVGASYAIGRTSLIPYLTGGIAFVSSQRNVDSSLVTGYYGLGLSIDMIVIDWFTLGADTRLVLIPGGIQQSDNTGYATTIDFLFLAGARL